MLVTCLLWEYLHKIFIEITYGNNKNKTLSLSWCNFWFIEVFVLLFLNTSVMICLLTFLTTPCEIYMSLFIYCFVKIFSRTHTHSHQKQTHIHTMFTYSVSHSFWVTIFIGSVVILYYAWFIFWWFMWAISRTQSFVLFTQTKNESQRKIHKISIEINRTVDCCIYFGTNGINFVLRFPSRGPRCQNVKQLQPK